MHSDSKIQKIKDKETQNTETQRHRDSKRQRFIDTETKNTQRLEDTKT